jgi:hypothetical protein
MRRHTVSTFFLVLLLVLSASELKAGPFTLTLTDNWLTPTFGVGQLPGGAGSGFTWTSAVNAALLRIRNPTIPPHTGWDITVRKVDIAWNAGLRVSVQRTGSGTGTAVLSGGLSYQQITGTDTFFFRGVGGDRRNIPLQYQITGMAAPVGVGTFSTTIWYTATEY